MTRFIYLAPTVLFLFGSVGCSGEDEGSRSRLGNNSSGNTDGNGDGSGGGGLLPGGGTGANDGGVLDPGGGGGGDDCGAVLPVTFRDFKGSGEPGGHADFELSATKTYQNDQGMMEIYRGWNDVGCGLVNAQLGPDGRPVLFTGTPDTENPGMVLPSGVGYRQRVVSGPGCWTQENPNPTGVCNVGTCVPWKFAPPVSEIGSPTTFGQWFTDVPNVNMTIQGSLELTETPPGSGIYVYDTDAFFPIDDEGFKITPGHAHNYHFTTEIRVKFTYQPGQKFTFRGDDDLWIFVNGRLALDVGGLHQALEGTIDFDLQADTLDIVAGQTYQMDIFHAERQTDQSNFRIETDITCFEPVVVR